MKYIIIAILIISQAGCSSIAYLWGSNKRIVMTGRGDYKPLISREEVRQKLGEPTRVDIQNGSECDVFIVDEMVADGDAAVDCFQMDLYTFFIAEIILFPVSLYDLSKRSTEVYEFTTHYSADEYLIRTDIKLIDRHKSGKRE